MNQSNHQIDAHLKLGRRLHAAGRIAEAGQVYRQILAASPDHPEALDMLGVLFLQTGQPDQALWWINRALAVKGSSADFHLHHAHALLALGRSAEAQDAAKRAIQRKRSLAEAHQALGRALLLSGDHHAALKAFKDAVRLKPDLMDGLNDLGTAQHHAGQLEEAARTLTRAAINEPREPTILLNLSSVLKSLGRFTEAEAKLTAAARLAPSNPHVLYNRALLLLLLGRFDEAWSGWDRRFETGEVPPPASGKPVWRGEPLDGRTLLILAEQGLGDTIQFCRFDLPSDGPVVLAVQPRIARLISSLPGRHTTVPWNAPPPFDLICPLMSLPAIARTTLDTIPAKVPYLFAEQEAKARWAGLIHQQGFRVGIAWQGNPERREDSGRSIELRHFSRLGAIPGVRLISLQKGVGAEQLAGHEDIEVLPVDFDTGPDGFIDTAAIMMNLDLVITSDTAIAHLAGALGRPVWVALRAVPDWRWLLDRTDSPWYPTMRLFRQRTRDDWASVFSDIQDALIAHLEAYHG
jgi:Flp pilus assembly protein TadD